MSILLKVVTFFLIFFLGDQKKFNLFAEWLKVGSEVDMLDDEYGCFWHGIVKKENDCSVVISFLKASTETWTFEQCKGISSLKNFGS